MSGHQFVSHLFSSRKIYIESFHRGSTRHPDSGFCPLNTLTSCFCQECSRFLQIAMLAHHMPSFRLRHAEHYGFVHEGFTCRSAGVGAGYR